MTNIIFLNGCGSAGKSSIAKAIQHISSEPWLHLGVDTFTAMIPDKFQGFGEKAKDGYYEFVHTKNHQGAASVAVVNKPLGDALFPVVAPRVAAMLAAYNHKLIIDEVLLSQEMVDAYVSALSDYNVLMVKVACDLAVMQQREILRGERVLGLATDQFDRVHKYKISYNLTVDTTSTSPFENAYYILNYIKNNNRTTQ